MTLDLDRPFGISVRAIAVLRALSALGPVDVVTLLEGAGRDTRTPSRWSDGTHFVYHLPEVRPPATDHRSEWARVGRFLWSLVRPLPDLRRPWPDDRPPPDGPYDVVWSMADANVLGTAIPATHHVWDMVDLALYGDLDPAGPGTRLRDVRRLGPRRVVGNRLRRRGLRRDYYEAHASLADLAVLSRPSEARASAIREPAWVPNGYPFAPPTVRPRPTPGERFDVLFVGNLLYPPNHDGMQWFLERVWPLVTPRLPHARLLLVGDGGRETLGSPPDRVQVLDRVDDLVPLLEGAAVNIAPILGGTGSRLKIIEAWAFGCPVVSTTVGAAGLEARHRDNLLLADTPEDFARALVALHDDPDLAQRIASSGRRAFDAGHSQERIDEAVRQAIRRLVASPPVGRGGLRRRTSRPRGG